MKKSLNMLFALTILSGCSTLEFWKSDDQKVDGPRHAPALNNGGMSSDANPSAMMMSAGNAPGQPMSPQPPPPPFGNDDFVSNPALAQAQNSAAMPLPNDRRPPEFNRQMLGSSAPSGDAAMASPTPSVTQTSMMPPQQTAQANLPQGNLMLPPPPPPVTNTTDNKYPRLADVPPAPPLPKPAAEDARVAQMKQDLADMQQQQSNFQSSGNSMSIKGGAGGPVVENQTPRKPGNGTNQPTLVAQSPADPYLANAQKAPQPPEPPQFNQAGQPIMPMPAPAQQMASQSMPPQQTMNQAMLMPQGPTVVVHSKNPNARPYTPQQTAMMAPPPPVPMQNMSSPSMTPMPPPAVQSSQLPPPNMQANSQQPGSFQRAPSMGKPASSLGGGSQMQSQTQSPSSSTSLSQLHPIAVQPVQSYASNNDAPAANSYSDSQSLQPIPTNNIRLLPASRYAAMRGDSRDGSGY